MIQTMFFFLLAFKWEKVRKSAADAVQAKQEQMADKQQSR